jgi:putative spermidine/putrescine transport system permease protein
MTEISKDHGTGMVQHASSGRTLSRFFYSNPGFSIFLLLALPLLWVGIVYFGSLGALIIQSLFHYDSYSGHVITKLTFENYIQLISASNLDIVFRTIGMAAAVTLASSVIAFPLAYYSVRYAKGRLKALLYLAVLLPLWSSYIVRVYSWKLILAREGIISWFFAQLGLSRLLDNILQIPNIGGPSLSMSMLGMWIVFVYIWLPYMILPIHASMERLPTSMLEASADLGARPGQTFWRITLPLVLPGVVAGSIFTFSLTMGDFIIPGTIGNSSLFIGQAVLRYQGTAGNIPLAAAMTAVPMAVMAIYLVMARKLGAFDAL